MRKPEKVVSIGSTPAEVMMTHAKRSVLYFAKNFMSEFKITPYQEEFLHRINKRDKNDKA